MAIFQLKKRGEKQAMNFHTALLLIIIWQHNLSDFVIAKNGTWTMKQQQQQPCEKSRVNFAWHFANFSKRNLMKRKTTVRVRSTWSASLWRDCMLEMRKSDATCMFSNRMLINLRKIPLEFFANVNFLFRCFSLFSFSFRIIERCAAKNYKLTYLKVFILLIQTSWKQLIAFYFETAKKKNFLQF